ncbi:MAG: hypothetical protein ACHQVK_05295, partial [Candidatus Paceibacterales bacterium]
MKKKKRLVRKQVTKKIKKQAVKVINPEVPKSEIKFGTDGWRAVISDTFTFKNVAIMAQGISEWINRDLRKKPGAPKRVAVGFDTRFLSETYAQIVSRVLAANNIE